ncbi:MAG: flippase [Nodosilinea sp.]
MPISWLAYVSKAVRRKLEESETRQITVNISWLLIDKMLRMVVSIFLGTWIARYLGPEKFGIFNYAVAFVGLFGSLASLGLDEIVIRDIVKYPQDKDRLINTTLALRVLATSVNIVLIIATSTWLYPRHNAVEEIIIITAIIVLPQIICETIDLWFKSQVNARISIIAKDLGLILSSFIKTILVINKATLVAFAWASFSEFLIAAIALIYLYTKANNKLNFRLIDLALAKRLLTDSWPFIFSGLAVIIYMRIDQIMISIMIGNQENGFYSAAVKLAEIWYFIPMILISSVYPKIISLKEKDNILFYKSLQKLYQVMTIIAYVTSISFSIFSGPIINFFYGYEYRCSAAMLAIMIWTTLFVNLGSVRNSLIMIMNWGKLHLLTMVIASFVNVILNILLIPKYGGLGAATATLIAQGLSAYGLCFCFPQLRETARMMTKAMTLGWIFSDR